MDAEGRAVLRNIMTSMEQEIRRRGIVLDPEDSSRWPEGRPGWIGKCQLWPCDRCGEEVDYVTPHVCAPSDG